MPTPTQNDIAFAQQIDFLLRAQRFAEVRPLLESRCFAVPSDFPARRALGVTLLHLGEVDQAISQLEAVVAAAPKYAAAFVDLANIYRQSGRYDDAARTYRTAITIEPNNADAHYNLALVLLDVGNEPQAIEALQRALMFKPQHALAQLALGNILAEANPEEACSRFRQALAAQPNMLNAQAGLIGNLAKLGRFDEAERVLAKALRVHPGDLLILRQNALIALMQGQLEKAAETYRQILQADPSADDVRLNLGSVYQMQGDTSKAQTLLEQAMSNRDDQKPSANLLNALASVRISQSEFGSAEGLMQEASAIAPQSPTLAAGYGRVLLTRGEVDKAIIQYKKATHLAPHIPELYSNLVYALHLDATQTPQTRFEAMKGWDERFANKMSKRPPIHNPSPDRRLRIGLISGDFRLHPVTHGLLPLLTHYNREQLEVFAYTTSYVEDEFTAKIKANVDHWRLAAPLHPSVLASKITRDGIDILIDMSVHTAGNRLVIFGQRAAPIQATWLGFFSGTGLSSMDYRLTDPIMDPVGQTEALHTERLMYLPSPFCYAADELAPAISPLPAESNGFVTFGALTHFNRVNQSVLDAWKLIFTALPTARLKVFSCAAANDAATTKDIANHLLSIGLSEERFDIIPWLPHRDFLDQVRAIDIVLDSFPYPGGMTTMDALWMGVPTITLAGQSSYERAGASILTLGNLEGLITHNVAEYSNTAIRIAERLDWLSGIRQSIRATLLKTPLLDGENFARAFESALRDMWREMIAK